MISAFITGFLGSFHCVGMCGGLALAAQARNWRSAVLYHLGRSLTYAGLGAMFGLLGRGLYIGGFQQYTSVIMGGLMIAFVLLPYQNFPFLFKLYQGFKKHFHPLQMKNKWLAGFLMGVLNGLLPCGLVYVAIFASVATADAWYGASYLFLFGMGTIPMLVLIGVAPKLLPLAWRARLVKAVPVFVVVVGIMLIVRGLNLNIPYLSPYLKPYIEITVCH